MYAAESIWLGHRQEMVAHVSLGFDLGNGGFHDAVGLLSDMRESMYSLLSMGDHVALPPLALGAAGEWPARHRYNDIWDSLRTEFHAGIQVADDLCDRAFTSARTLTAAESAAERAVLDAAPASRA
ncbi:hypothetical protein AB0H88_42360 [Nonomuraea sp. NPDC050680]|uniref:hypothetical protein n=1 Tax=Nonomuraea sp. NPDC050680 TaxID=3154630 RepID=UPI0033FEB9F4